MRVLVTGASGFIGGALIQSLAGGKHFVRGAYRSQYADGRLLPPGSTIVGDLRPDNDWSSSLEGCEVVVHTAARVHVLHDKAKDPLAEYRRANLYGTLNLATQAAKKGVHRFVFLSSIKVNGENTLPGLPFTSDDAPHPTDPYGQSKRETEDALFLIARETGMEVVVIRPALVYGPGVKANFLTMMRLLEKGFPIPLGSVENRRSMIALKNLIALIELCMIHPAAANHVYLASDGEDLSTPELLMRLGAAMNVPVRLIPFPVSLLKLGSAMIGKKNIYRRLCDSLQVDVGKAKRDLAWLPIIDIDSALRETATHYLAHKER